jgi:hypothetical protein
MAKHGLESRFSEQQLSVQLETGARNRKDTTRRDRRRRARIGVASFVYRRNQVPGAPCNHQLRLQPACGAVRRGGAP